MNHQEFMDNLLNSYPEYTLPKGPQAIGDLLKLIQYCSEGVLDRMLKEIKKNFRAFPTYADFCTIMSGLGIAPERNPRRGDVYMKTFSDSAGRPWAKRDGFMLYESKEQYTMRIQREACDVGEGMEIMRASFEAAGGRHGGDFAPPPRQIGPARGELDYSDL